MKEEGGGRARAQMYHAPAGEAEGGPWLASFLTYGPNPPASPSSPLPPAFHARGARQAMQTRELAPPSRSLASPGAPHLPANAGPGSSDATLVPLAVAATGRPA